MSKELEREFYIFGEAVYTELCEVKFLTYKQYLMNINQLSLMSLNVLHVYYQYRKMFENQKPSKEDRVGIEAYLDELKKQSLFDIMLSDKSISNAYYRIFQLVITDEDVIEKIFDDADLFMLYRELVLDMQITIEDEVSPNPEIQRGIDRSRSIKSSSSEVQTPTDIITSIVAGTPNSFEDVCNMTVYQVYAVFYRLGALKSYDTETLFATVSNDIKISSWSRNIDLFKKEDSSAIKRSVFEENTKTLF